jgi:hypothetical protein
MMADLHKLPALDYDPADAGRIEQLLEEARQHPERKVDIYKQLDELIFGLHAQD